MSAGTGFFVDSGVISAGDVVLDEAALCGAFAATALCISSVAGPLLGGLLAEEKVERGAYG